MTFLTDRAIDLATVLLFAITLFLLDTLFVRLVGDVDTRLAAALVGYSWGAVLIFVQAESIDQLGVIGHIVIRAILFPAVWAAVTGAVWVLG